MSYALKSAAEEVKKELVLRVERIRSTPEMVELLQLHQSLNTLEDVLKQPRTPLSEFFGLDAASPDATPTFALDEFYGLDPLEAAKKYLRAIGKARPFEEILTVITAHGAKVPHAEILRKSLSRSTYEVAKVGRDAYGLVEFYDHVQRGKKKRTDSGDLRSGPEEDATQVENTEDVTERFVKDISAPVEGAEHDPKAKNSANE